MAQTPCPSCGAPVESSERACPYCGAAISAPVSSSAPTVRVSRAEAESIASGGVDQLQRVREQIERGNKIEAIKIYREMTGVGLKEAKDAVDAMAAGQPVEFAAATMISAGPLLAGQSAFGNSAEAMDAIKAELRAGRKIEAIKIHRQYFNTGLAEAKTAVEQIETNMQFETVTRLDTDVPAFAQPNAPSVEPAMSANPFDEPQKPSSARRWLIGCGIAAVVLICLCIAGLLVFMLFGNWSFGQ